MTDRDEIAMAHAAALKAEADWRAMRDHAARLVIVIEGLRGAEDIVRALAEDGAIVHTDGDWRDWHVCGLCDASLPLTPKDHEIDCIWRRADAWVKEHA